MFRVASMGRGACGTALVLRSGFPFTELSVPPSFCACVSSVCQRAPTDRPAGHSDLRSLTRHRYLTAGEAERQNIDAAQQGLESTR